MFTGPYLPEPVDLLAVLGVMSVDGVLLPVGQIDLLHPTKHQLQKGQRRGGYFKIWSLNYSHVTSLCVLKDIFACGGTEP